MTPNEVRIAEWLKLEVPELHPAFANVVELRGRTDFPGRSNLICHACRDICTEIQQYLKVEKTIVTGDNRRDPRRDYSTLRGALGPPSRSGGSWRRVRRDARF
jgi:hypothetical protein